MPHGIKLRVFGALAHTDYVRRALVNHFFTSTSWLRFLVLCVPHCCTEQNVMLRPSTYCKQDNIHVRRDKIDWHNGGPTDKGFSFRRAFYTSVCAARLDPRSLPCFDPKISGRGKLYSNYFVWYNPKVFDDLSAFDRSVEPSVLFRTLYRNESPLVPARTFWWRPHRLILCIDFSAV